MSWFMQALFGQGKPAPSLDEQMKEWKRKVRQEASRMERDIHKVELEMKKAEAECRLLAKKKNEAAAKLMARHVLKARQGVARMYDCKAQLTAIQAEIARASSMVKVQGCLKKSTEVMHSMNKLLRLPEMSETMRSLATEMTKAGLIVRDCLLFLKSLLYTAANIIFPFSYPITPHYRMRWCQRR